MFDRKKIVLSADLYGRAVQAAREGGYATVEEFVTHVLEREIDKIFRKNPGDSPDPPDALDRRLEGLGYLG